MRILIQPPEANSGAHHVGDEVRRALDVLNRAFIKTDGGGTVSSDGGVTGVLVLSSEGDASRALERLAQAGIKASAG
jgi:hypothetical protein